MAVLGPADLKDLALPSLWDNSEILKFRLQDGTTFEELLAELRDGLGAFNRTGLIGMENYGSLVAVQDDPEVEYATYTTRGVEELVEYKIADPGHGTTTGHMIGLKAWNISLAWTMRYLQKARRAKLDSDVRMAFTDMRDHWQNKLLSRFFSSTARTVGASGKNVPFADGGTADSTYIPYKSPRGDVFTSTHSHFLGQAATLTTALVDAAVKHLWEHGHTAPYTGIIPEADISTWAALSSFKKPDWADIAYHASASERARGLSNVDMDIFGYIETPFGMVRLWATPRIPTKYWGLFKDYGAGDARNPLRVRFDPGVGFGWNIVPGLLINAPQLMAAMMSEFDIGVGEDRTNGVAVFNDAGATWVNPTVS